MSGFVPTLIDKSEQVLSPWVTLVARSYEGDGAPRVFHSLKQADYVVVLAITSDGRIPLVRQYRPCWEAETLEFPAGLLETNELPEQCAQRELREEVGLVCTDGLLQLAVLKPDTGRLENRLWCYFAPNVALLPDWSPESGVSREWATVDELMTRVSAGTFDHALHVAVLSIAMIRRLI